MNLNSRKIILLGLSFCLIFCQPIFSQSKTSSKTPIITAKAAIVVDARNGGVLYGKNQNLRLPPASTTKVMTVIVAMERLKLNQLVKVSRNAFNAPASRAGLTQGASYTVFDLITACLVSSSNDAAVALAEAIAGDERQFAVLMNEKAQSFGMTNTRFINSTGLPEKNKKQYSTVYDLSLLMRQAAKNKLIDDIMAFTYTSIRGTDDKSIPLRSHNKMLWRIPKFVKGKTGWTLASRHTFAGMDYASQKKVIVAMLYSQKPWADIERLVTLGHALERKHWWIF